MRDSSSLKFITGTAEMLRCAIESSSRLSEHLQVEVPEDWCEQGREIFEHVHERVLLNPGEAVWWIYFCVHRSSNTLVGTCGYKGPPVNGCIEIGYETASGYRNTGLASEMANALVSEAFGHDEVSEVIAHTHADNKASAKVLLNCGMTYIKDDGNGEELWMIRKLAK